LVLLAAGGAFLLRQGIWSAPFRAVMAGFDRYDQRYGGQRRQQCEPARVLHEDRAASCARDQGDRC
jgi:hypothetical protein